MIDHRAPADPHDEDEAGAWEPAGLVLPKVGDRVRIRLNGECQLRPCPGSYYERIGQVGHPPYENGLTGVVTSWELPNADVLAQQGHAIDVDYDADCRPEIGDGRRARGGTYCAMELVVLDSDGPAAAGREHQAPEAEAGRS